MIGIFDSGYGGLNILKSLLRGLPEYDYLYSGDNARAYSGRANRGTAGDWLERHPEFETRLPKTGARRFLTTDDPLHFRLVASEVLGIEVGRETIAID
jgi:glutamate racemase